MAAKGKLAIPNLRLRFAERSARLLNGQGNFLTREISCVSLFPVPRRHDRRQHRYRRAVALQWRER